MGNPAQADALRNAIGLTRPFICDPEQALYHAFELGKGSFGQMFNPTTFVRGMQATMKGHGVGKPVGDPWQMPGAFVLDSHGNVIWEFRARHAADHPDFRDVQQALESA